MTKINPKSLLRFASATMLLHAAGHTMAILTWQKPGGKIPFAVVQKMQEVHFLFGGRDATMAEFFSGHGYAGTILLLMITAILWALSSWTDKKTATILWFVGIAILALAVDELLFFFPVAAIFSLLAATMVFLSLFQINKQAQ